MDSVWHGRGTFCLGNVTLRCTRESPLLSKPSGCFCTKLQLYKLYRFYRMVAQELMACGKWLLSCGYNRERKYSELKEPWPWLLIVALWRAGELQPLKTKGQSLCLSEGISNYLYVPLPHWKFLLIEKPSENIAEHQAQTNLRVSPLWLSLIKYSR